MKIIIWKKIIIDGNETGYEISSDGCLKNTKTGNIIKGHDCGGYIHYRLHCSNNYYNQSAHRLVAQAFIPNPNNLPQVNHINGIKNDNRVENLEWVTAKDNIRHAFDTGLANQQGERNNASKFSEKEIVEICELLESGNYTCREISSITGMNFDTIGHISRKERWKHITKNYDFNNIKRKYHNHSEITVSVDRAIKSGKSRKEIIETLIDFGLTKNQATNLYKRRKKSVEEGKSLVNYTIYIDNGIEIF